MDSNGNVGAGPLEGPVHARLGLAVSRAQETHWQHSASLAGRHTKRLRGKLRTTSTLPGNCLVEHAQSAGDLVESATERVDGRVRRTGRAKLDRAKQQIAARRGAAD